MARLEWSFRSAGPSAACRVSRAACVLRASSAVDTRWHLRRVDERQASGRCRVAGGLGMPDWCYAAIRVARERMRGRGGGYAPVRNALGQLIRLK